MLHLTQTSTDALIVRITDSLRSLTLSGDRHARWSTDVSFLDERSLEASRPEQILHQMLSTRVSIPTYVDNGRNKVIRGGRPIQSLALLGKGQCGTVWALPGTTMALKIMNDGKMTELWNDCCTHKIVEEAFESSTLEFRRDINIPAFGDWVQPSNTTFWKSCVHRVPKGPTANYALLTEKIHSLPVCVRSAIVDVFAPPDVKRHKLAFLAHKDNQHCLVRLYLGRRMQRLANSTFRLCNFDLMINEMEHLRLDTRLYATVMAKALAILHWKAGIDANDVEFVLGTAPKFKKAATAAEFMATGPDAAQSISQTSSFHHDTVGIWLLDFNECKAFTKDAAGLVQLRNAFYFNDPYYPRPGSANAKDKILWETFKVVYLTFSAKITASKMPEQFIAAVEAEGVRRSGTASLFG